MFDVFDVFFGFGSLAGAGFFLFLYKLVKDRHEPFRNALAGEGVITAVTARQYPVIEYQRDGKTVQFRSDLSAPGARVGQRIDIEIDPQGAARIRSSGHGVIKAGLLVSSVAFAVTGIVFLVKRFA